MLPEHEHYAALSYFLVTKGFCIDAPGFWRVPMERATDYAFGVGEHGLGFDRYDGYDSIIFDARFLRKHLTPI